VRSADQPVPISEMVRGIRGLRIVKMDGRDYFEVRRKGPTRSHARGAGRASSTLVTGRIRTRSRRPTKVLRCRVGWPTKPPTT
jgi:hypothetical protein